MNQFFFGSADHPLYGVHHPPAGGQRQNSAVLVCYPTGREYMRCHRALVRLCDRLAESGYHTMRFDYSGTGDSAGEDGVGSVEAWLGNIDLALQELRDISGVQKVSLLGVRLGAALAAYAASKQSAVDKLILWDPVVDGRRYIEQMVTLHGEFILDVERFPAGGRRERKSSGGELIGMAFPDAMKESIEKIDLSSVSIPRSTEIAIIATDDRDEYRSVLNALASGSNSAGYHPVNEKISWNVLSDLGVVVMPHALLQKVSDIMLGIP